MSIHRIDIRVSLVNAKAEIRNLFHYFHPQMHPHPQDKSVYRAAQRSFNSKEI